MNEIVVDISKFKPEVQEELRKQAVRTRTPMKLLLANLIEKTTETILKAAGDEEEGAA